MSDIRATLFRRGVIDGVLLFDMEAFNEHFSHHFRQLERFFMDALQPLADKVTALEGAVGTLKTDNATLVALAIAQGAQLAAIVGGQTVDGAEIAALAARLDAVTADVTGVDTADTGATTPSTSTGTTGASTTTGDGTGASS